MGTTNFIFSQKTEDNAFKKVRRIATKLVKKKKVPGLAISIVKNDSLIFSEGFGYANINNKTLVDPSKTVFRIASVSKPLAAIGLAKLVERGKIDLGASLYNYVPYFPKKKHDFSIKQLGSHLAGIRGYKGNEVFNNLPLSIKEGLRFFDKDSLLFPPGTDYFYTSYGWNLLALAMEEASKKPFETYISENILTPLGLINTYPDRSTYVSNKATFYRKKRFRTFKEVKPVHNYYKLASGGFLSTSEDIAKFGKALLNETLISKALLKVFTTSQKIGDKKTYYGIGFEASMDHKGRAYYGHVGNGVGGYAMFYVYPKEKMVISILMNCSNPKQDRRFKAIIDGCLSD